MAVGVIMPRQGQSVESCIIAWKVKEGDTVKEGDILFGYETDKASFEEESEVSGTVLKLLVEDGEDVPCLDNVCVIGEPGEDISAFLSDETQEAVQEETGSETTQETVSEEKPAVTAKNGDKIKISPRAKGIAERQGLDISKAEATGPDGRIIERDIAVLAKKGYKVTGRGAGCVYRRCRRNGHRRRGYNGGSVAQAGSGGHKD